jgi:uncharacterized glyoxalase superfamily protein PhnB
VSESALKLQISKRIRVRCEEEDCDTMKDIGSVPSVIPVLGDEDIQKALDFYRKLGFSEVFSIPDQAGNLAHAHLRKGDSAVFLGRLDVSHNGGNPRADTIRGSRSNDRGLGVTLVLQVDNLASVYDIVCREKLEVLAEPVDEYYGDRVFFFLDPFGYEWKISQPIPAG